jgi:hypothetical protein
MDSVAIFVIDTRWINPFVCFAISNKWSNRVHNGRKMFWQPIHPALLDLSILDVQGNAPGSKQGIK